MNEDGRMRVIHEDAAFVVAVKASGLLSISGKGPGKADCVANRVHALYPGCINHPCVHRLDMDTSGLMVVARTTDAHRHLSIQFQDRQTTKRYVALLEPPPIPSNAANLTR
jgi:tRNA pseudouridine32 synthase / 23S rRNA pseudouridine746 synthase